MGVKRDAVEIRNIGLPLAIRKPNLYIKTLITGVVTLLTLILLNTIFEIRVSRPEIIVLVLTLFFLWFYNKKYNSIHNILQESKMVGAIPCAVIGFSNKVIILSGEDVLDEIETDEIEIRELTLEERQEHYWYTSALNAKKNGKVIKIIYVEGIREYEGNILNANPDRANEDIEIIYDDNRDEDEYNEDEDNEDE